MNDVGVQVFNVRDFGALGNGKTLDTLAIQAAIDACATDGGGMVLVPAGDFLIGPVELKSDVTLHLAAGATLLATTDISQYQPARGIPLQGDHTMGDGNTGLVYAANSQNVTIEGKGTIDGQGALVRGGGLGGNKRCHLTLFYKCRNLVIKDVYMYHSCYHTCRICNCEYVQIEGIRIFSRVVGNNDGLHFISAAHVSVTNCTVRCQDDACALFGSCKFITITNSLFSTRWSAFRFGGGVAENIAVSNCILYQVYGCPIKLRCEPGSRFENMSFSDLILQEVTGPISIGAGVMGNRRRATTQGAATQQASTRPSPLPETDVREKTADGKLAPATVRNISFSNISGTTIGMPQGLDESTFASGGNPGEMHSSIILNCTEGHIIERISFNDVRIEFGGGGTRQDGAKREMPQIAGEYYAIGTSPAYGLYARGVHGLTVENMRVSVREKDQRPAVVLDGVRDGVLRGVTMQGNTDAESVMRFQNVTDVLVSSPRIIEDAALFLQVEGERTNRVTIEGGDIRKAGKMLALANGAADSAVRLRE